jgi:hypothetical protein
MDQVIFSVAAGFEILARRPSEPVSFWSSKIVGFQPQIDEAICVGFSELNQGESLFPLRSIGTYRSKLRRLFAS